jgi:hypothetical protein
VWRRVCVLLVRLRLFSQLDAFAVEEQQRILKHDGPAHLEAAVAESRYLIATKPSALQPLAALPRAKVLQVNLAEGRRRYRGGDVVIVATFNVENLFERPRAVNLPSWSEGQPAIDAAGELAPDDRKDRA